MERCDVSSATLSAIADMPLTLAMALKVGAWGLLDFPAWLTPWQPAQVRNASFQPRVALPISCANTVAFRNIPTTTIRVTEISLL